MLLSNLNLLATAPGGVARLRELILTLAVQGKLVPQDPSDEPASELLKKIRAEKDRLIAEGKIKRDKPLAAIAEEEKPFGLPKGWEWVRLGGTMEMLNGKPFKPTEWLPSGLPIVRIQNLNKANAPFNYCDPALVAEKNRIDSGSFLISWSGTPGTSFGAFIWQRGAAALNQHIFKCELLGNVFVPEFLKLSINSQLNVLIAQAQGGVGLQHVTKGVLESLVLVLPPLAEQSRIVTRVEELMRLCDALEAKGQLEATQHAQLISTLLATLTDSETPAQLADNWHRIATHFDLLLDRPEAVDALEQTILQLAVRGLLVPQDPQDEPASALLKKIRAEKDKLIAEDKIKRDKPLPPVAEDEQPFALPQGWVWCRLGDVAVSGPTNGLSPRPVEIPTDIKCLSLSATTQGLFRPECFKYVDISVLQAKQFWLKRGDLLIQRGNSLDYVGIAALYNGPDDAYIYPDLMMRLQLSQLVSAAYVHSAMVCIEGRDYFKRSATGTQGTMPKVNQATVAGAPLPLPPLAEQSRIVTRVAQLRRLCADLRQRLSASQSTQAHLAEALVQEVA
ncbi:MAG: restriction endonuclease subunit S [Polaromonas sp.]|uniref:restriction endonuclease subunit S n=1 Tax=Polaromonas sp. TaxID=1869339 RepID=UPI002730E835|nr:restriction endonuclease subunit S [Polaromonas sp.]MDP2448725.1 restriction endonuclease subunit S [Polaromonas sp.]MDP3248634.1 restriction endonuclease subunit S [Polaromonas sp.]MDP3758046.1 restriction endonuclease subunit S [Polaromonas sp.]